MKNLNLNNKISRGLLCLFFGPLGILLFSWKISAILLIIQFIFCSIAGWSTLAILIFWYLIPIFVAVFVIKNQRKLILTTKSSEKKLEHATENEVKININKLNQRIRDHKDQLFIKIKELANEALEEVYEAVFPEATKPWQDFSPQALHTSQREYGFPKNIRIGQFIHKAIQESKSISLPCYLPLSKRKGLILCTSDNTDACSENLLQDIALRIACSLRPEVLQIHLIDLQSKGRAFSLLGALDHKLAPLAPTTPEQVTTLLKNLESRVSDVTRRCLSRHEWLCDFNEANPDEAEPYHIICFSRYPLEIENSALESISRLFRHECAARAGIYFLISSGEEKPEAPEFTDVPIIFTGEDNAELFDNKIYLSENGKLNDLEFVPEELPENAAEFINALNAVAKAQPKVKKVSISVDKSLIWKSSAASGVSIPIGKTGRDQLFFRLGNDSVVHHALVGGATGTGKTILLHNIILNAAELYSPEDLQMILMDFKEGTEFACYEGLPHMRVLSIASELHFGLSVFEWLVAERMRRATLFKTAGVANLADYISKSGQKLPRILVLMDEFQRLLSDPRIGLQVSTLLDDIVRTGRSFGINLILSTQSLANVQMEASTLTSLGVRICLRLSEQETNKFLGHDNSVPARFNRAGQALYNDTEGRQEGNTEFQVAFVDVSEIPGRCQLLRERETESFGRQVVKEARVFHGESPINPNGRVPKISSDKLQAYIGEPLKIQAAPIAITFDAQDGANLLVLGQEMEALNTLSSNLVAQFVGSPLTPEILIVDAFPLAKERWASAMEKAGSNCRLLDAPVQVNSALDQLTMEIENRKMDTEAEAFPPKILFLAEPQLSKAFPAGNGMDSSPAALKVNTILEQGPRVGIHTVLLTSRLNRTTKVIGQFDRLNMQHFATRIAFRSDEAETLLGYQAPIKNMGEYSGVLSDESTGEMTPFQTYNTITT
jgi:S-DNA-T family DNA segregation ATPase FtsK/SpoIIIE